MYSLSNNFLEVQILDPIANQAHFGVRYCTGGYIYQVVDPVHGDLLSGPTYPDSFNWFDGQGIPDAFNLAPLRAPGGSDREVLLVGIGLCDLEQKQVKAFCQWEVEANTTALRLQTRQQFHGHALQLERTVSLLGRTVRSHTHISNQGDSFIPLCWFPHPFYPQPATDELCRLNIPLQLADNPGYWLAENGYIHRRQMPGQAGFYLPLDHQAQNPLVISQRHPKLGLVSAHCSYVPSFFPIWGNLHTFSWEPFFERMLAPGQAVTWSIDYSF